MPLVGFFSFVQSLFKSSDKAGQADVPDDAQAPNTPDAEESFEMDSDAGHIVSIADLPLKADSSVLDSRWPPFPRAVQVLSPKHLINAQAELVRNLCSAIPLSDDEVERYLMPVVWNLACFVHLLPASAHHHHRGLGGLFGHSLETAIFAAQTAKNKIFDYKAKPEDAYMNKARWILACALAGLTHDVGKAVLDIRVYSDKGTWHPTTGSITEWCRAKGISAYYVAMNEDREHNKHEQASLAYARVIIPRRTYLYLSQTGNSKIEEELHAAINGQREGCLVGEILGEADSLSVKLDERRQGTIDPRDKLVTTPLADAIVKAMRSLIKEGTWKINTQDANVWLTTQGCFIDWSDVSDITKVLAAEGVKSVPHDNSAMASMLLTEGLIEAAPGTVSPDERFWSVCPFILKDRTITGVKFRVPVRLIGSVASYAAMPVYIPNQPMLEADAKAWLSAYGFDPASDENEQVEEEDYLNQLMESVAAAPAAYQTPNVGYYTKDEEDHSDLISALLPPVDPDMDMLDDPALDIGVPSEAIANIENQVLQSDFCDEEAWEAAGETRCTQEDEVPPEPVDSHQVEPRESTPIESNPEASNEAPQDSSRTEEEQNESSESQPSGKASGNSGKKVQQNPAVIVDVTPALKIEEDIEPAAAQPVVVKPEDVEMPEAPKGYQKLDVSEDAFARLLPGGTRKKRSRKKAQPQADPVDGAKATDIADAADGAEAAGGTRDRRVQEEDLPGSEAAAGEEAEHPGAQAGESANRIESNRGNARIDSNPQSTRSEESVKLEADGEIASVEEPGSEPQADEDVPVGIDAVAAAEDDEEKEDKTQSTPEVTVPARAQRGQEPSSPAEGSRTESIEPNASKPKQEEKASVKETPLTETVKVIAAKCGSNHRQAAKELMNEMKRQMLNRRGDLLASQVWKNIVGFVTDDKGFKAAMEALHISLPVMTMELMKYQPMPKLEWDREEGKMHLKIEKQDNIG